MILSIIKGVMLRQLQDSILSNSHLYLIYKTLLANCSWYHPQLLGISTNMSWLCSGTCVGSSVSSLANDMKPWCCSCQKSSAHHLKLKRLHEWIPQNTLGIAAGASFRLVEIPTNSCRQFDQTSWPYVPFIHTIVLMWGMTKGLFLELCGEPCGLHQKLLCWRSAQGLGQPWQQSREKMLGTKPNSNKIWSLSSIEWQFENRYMLNMWRQVFASVGYKVSFLLQ